jgi:hypothetical protein
VTVGPLAAEARTLYKRWDAAYLDFADERDGDAAARPAVHRAMSVSRLAAAVAEFTAKDCRDSANFASMMYELAAGLDWEDDELINAVRRELALS